MRIPILILISVILPFMSFAQDSNAIAAKEYYKKGLIEFEKRNYLKAERSFRKAFSLSPDENAAEFAYRSTLLTGNDLEANAFLKHHKSFLKDFILPKSKFEYLYINAGERFAANPKLAGNVFYGDIGITGLLRPSVRLWQTFNFLAQNKNITYYRQYQSFTSLTVHAKNGFKINPSFAYLTLPYTTTYSEIKSVHYHTRYPAGQGDSIVYNTSGTQTISYSIPGHSNFYDFALNLSKRLSRVNIELEPAFQFTHNKNRVAYQYTTTGTTDSSFNTTYLGSKPFYETGSSSGKDTVVNRNIFQLGAAISFIPPIKGEKLFLRLGFAYLHTPTTQTTAGNLYMNYKAGDNLWLHVNLIKKGPLPWLNTSEGQYYNFSNKIKVRATFSVQLFPLKRFSPVFSYQYESNIRSRDNAELTYHSLYLTANFRL